MAIDPVETQRLLMEKQKEIGKRYADIPSQFKLPSDDPQLGALRSSETAKIQELYEHDKRLADRYANPESEAYLEDPYAREKARATQFQGTLGEIGGIQEQVAKRKDVLEDALNRGLQIFLAGIQGLEKEADFLDKILEKEEKKKEKKSSDILSILKETGGAIPSTLLEELGLPAGLSLPEPTGKSRGTSIVDIGGRKVLVDDQTGETIKDLGPSGGDTKGGDKTAEYISQVKTYKSREEALKEFEIYKPVMKSQGADVEAIRNAIDAYFPEVSKSPTKATGNEFVKQGLLQQIFGAIGGK